MERYEAGVKLENSSINHLGSSFHPDHVQISSAGFPLQGLFFDSLSDQLDKGGNSSLGFMELLGIQDYGNPSLLDMVQVPYATVQRSTGPPPTPTCTNIAVPNNHSNNTTNQQQPGTPISSSISSASSEALNDEEQVKGFGGVDGEGGDDDEQEQKKKAKKELKAKKTNQKKQKEPRFAFMTKSEVDHLEDGYRWRKYGQKAVKNSPFPRSYYRCTTASCNVKKRVERSFTDPSIVVTTYEGQHNHHSPIMARPSFTGATADRCYPTAGALGMPMQMRPPLHQQQHLLNNFSHLGGFGYNASAADASRLLQERLLCTPQGASLLKDHGLLQDLVPPRMYKEEF